METSIVTLEIPHEWNVWRIYRIEEGDNKEEGGDLDIYWDNIAYGDEERPWYVCCPDPTNENAFDDAILFPTIKPDRDVFGPPGRGRKQRGWYYVRPWPQATKAPKSMRSRRSTGADVPQELFDKIVEYCRIDVTWTKRDLGMLRLVCRRWEDLCLEDIFDGVYVENRRRMTDFMALQNIRRARGWRAYPISQIYLVMDLTTVIQPWINYTARLGGSRCILRIEGPMPAGRRLTSVYLSSPDRSLWNPLIIQKLYLDDVHFKKPGDLVRLMRELPCLRSVGGKKVTWDTSDEEYPRTAAFVPCKDPSPHVEYRFSDGQPDFYGNAVLACALSPSGARPISQPDTDALYRLVVGLGLYEESVRTRRQVSLRRQLWSDICLQVDVFLAPTYTATRVSVVQYIAFLLASPEIIHSEVMPLDAVAAHIEPLASRPEVILVFNFAEQASLFRERVAVPKMTSLSAQNRLKYVLMDQEKDKLSVIEYDEEGSWVAVAEASFRWNWEDFLNYDPEQMDSYRNVIYDLFT